MPRADKPNDTSPIQSQRRSHWGAFSAGELVALVMSLTQGRRMEIHHGHEKMAKKKGDADLFLEGHRRQWQPAEPDVHRHLHRRHQPNLHPVGTENSIRWSH